MDGPCFLHSIAASCVAAGAREIELPACVNLSANIVVEPKIARQTAKRLHIVHRLKRNIRRIAAPVMLAGLDDDTNLERLNAGFRVDEAPGLSGNAGLAYQVGG